MGATTSHENKTKKSVINEQAILKTVWSECQNNLQYHANIFFAKFCTAYPQYTKYFTFNPDMPLTIDTQTSSKFLMIMDAMGYLLVYLYNKPKQLKFLIGYIAMVHKDMDLTREDMTNFAEFLTNYLASSHPESRTIYNNYIKKMIDEISNNIEDLQKDQSLLDQYSTVKFQLTCMGRTYKREKLIYGYKLDYWIKRKRTWEERLRDWKLRKKRMTIVSPKDSSSDDDEDELSPVDEDNDISTIDLVESFQVWERQKHSGTSKQLMDDENIRELLPRRRIAKSVKSAGKSEFEVEQQFANPTNIKINGKSLIKEDERFSSNKNLSSVAAAGSSSSIIKVSLPSTSAQTSVIDSPARRRRRHQLKQI